MTSKKYQGHNCPLEERDCGIESNVSDIKNMVSSMYGRLDELVDTAEAIHKVVTYEQNGSRYTSDDNLDFLDEED